MSQDNQTEFNFSDLRTKYRSELRDFQFNFIETEVLPVLQEELENLDADPETVMQNFRDFLSSGKVSSDTVVAVDAPPLTTFERFVLAYLEFKSEDGASYVSYSEVVNYCKKVNAPSASTGSVGRAFKSLKNKGYISREKMGPCSAYKTTIEIPLAQNPKEVLVQLSDVDPEEVGYAQASV